VRSAEDAAALIGMVATDIFRVKFEPGSFFHRKIENQEKAFLELAFVHSILTLKKILLSIKHARFFVPCS
jgi:hypothetical protein